MTQAMSVKAVMRFLAVLLALAMAASVSQAAAKPTWIGDCWGLGLKSKAGRELLQRSNINYVKILARVEYMQGDIRDALNNPRHRPWPWFDPHYRESLDSLIRKAAAIGLKVELCLDPGWVAVSPEFRHRLLRGDRKPDEGSAWLFPHAKSGYSDQQIWLYADLFARTAAYCDKTYPGVVKWIEVGNELGFPQENYCKLVEAVTAAMAERQSETAVVADALYGRLARQVPSDRLPDIVGFHHLPAFARAGSRYPSQAEIVLALRRSLSGQHSYRGRPIEIRIDKWNPSLRGENMRDPEVWKRVLDRLAEQQRLGVGGSCFISFFADARHTDPTAPWALSWADGVTSPGFGDIARRIDELCSKRNTSGSASFAPPSKRNSG